MEWSVEKSAPDEVLIWCLAAGSNLPSDSSSTGDLYSGRRLAVRGIPPGGSENSSRGWSGSTWRWGLTRQAVAAKSA